MSNDQNISVPFINNTPTISVPSIRLRTYYSLHHIKAAIQFTKLSKEIESAYSGEFKEDQFFEHRAYVTGAIILSTSFLEATINELFSDAVDHPSSEHLAQLPEETRILFASVWGLSKTDMLSILDKYDLALALAKSEAFDKGANPFQAIHLLVKLRNALVHYVPEWSSHNEPTYKWETQLKAAGFSLNPMMKTNPFFPDQCLRVHKSITSLTPW